MVFIGTKPGRESLAQGHYYANPGNSFWDDLFAVGFTGRRIPPHEDESLIEFGIGLDDVYGDPVGPRGRIEACGARAVCFNSKQALERFVRLELKRGEWTGAKTEPLAQLGRLTWAVHDGSWSARRYRSERQELLHALRKQVALPTRVGSGMSCR